MSGAVPLARFLEGDILAGYRTRSGRPESGGESFRPTSLKICGESGPGRPTSDKMCKPEPDRPTKTKICKSGPERPTTDKMCRPAPKSGRGK